MKILVSILLGLLAIGAVAQGNDDLTMNNNRFVKFLASGNVDDGVKIGRFSGNALRVSYQGNVIAFDALDNRAIIFNNAGNQTKIQLHPAGKSFIKGGDFGVGLSNPDAKFHVLSDAVDINSTDEKAANLIIEASSGTRSMNEGATLGFVIPANTNGGNAWQQGRIMVTPNNESNANASGRMLLQTRYYNSGSWEWQNNLTLTAGGSVGVDVINPTEKLEVNGTIRSKEVKVEAAPWPDYVFSEGYELPDLGATADFIKANKHLPGIPSATEVAEQGILLGEMNAKLLEKIEELTLYVIELKNDNQNLSERVIELESKIK